MLPQGCRIRIHRVGRIHCRWQLVFLELGRGIWWRRRKRFEQKFRGESRDGRGKTRCTIKPRTLRLHNWTQSRRNSRCMEDRIQRTKAGRERRRSWTRERRGGAGWKTGSRRRSAGIELQQEMRKWGGGVHGCRGVHGRTDCRVRSRSRERRKQEKQLLALHFPFLLNIKVSCRVGKNSAQSSPWLDYGNSGIF